MKILKSIEEIKQLRKKLAGKVGFVPTMGYLHEGHLSLIDAAQKECQTVFVSIFVNPTQFAPNEDLSSYPRDFEKDKQLLEKRGVDFLFFPSESEMYPLGYQTYVSVEELSKGLCGRSRPDHFRGVATVVLKLFNIFTPDYAYFGQKDAQQCAVIRRMVLDLNLDVNIRVEPIVRDYDGLALSSRNKYLSKEERADALILPQLLQRLRHLILKGQISSRQEVIGLFHSELQAQEGVKPDYIDIVDPSSLISQEKCTAEKKRLLLAAAIWLGKTRLIDNVLIDFENHLSEG